MSSHSEDNNGPIVIVGGGHAGAQLCASLAEAKQGARVHLVCDEAELPYQRPPLSKAFLKDAQAALQPHRPEAWYAEHGISVYRADGAVAIERERRIVRLASGRELPYARLVLATGAHARRLPHLPPHGLANVAVLRSAADALALRERLAATRRMTVLGGGFIGLEIAASARAMGLEVEVLEGMPRLLARSVSPGLAAHVQASHEAAGVRLRLAVRVGEFEIADGRLAALQVDGVRQDVELLVLGIGAAPETALAHAAGLVVDNGIEVDACMRTSDPSILAVGDCCSFPCAALGGQRARLESVQNATDQARTAAATLLGRDEPYRALPWFWSEQGALRLQMAGLMPADGTPHRRPGANAASFSILHYDAAGRFACVESVNAALDHVMSRKLLEAGKSPAPELACDPAVALKSLL
jgi:3-phenylpropionate/trans-cinnamate dioxygenase ferredoxin reductase subunit